MVRIPTTETIIHRNDNIVSQIIMFFVNIIDGTYFIITDLFNYLILRQNDDFPFIY